MKVLIALDGSQAAEAAVAGLAPWARSAGAEVILCSVLHPEEIHETMAPRGVAHAVPILGAPSGQALPGASDPALRARAAEDRTQALARAHDERRDRLAAVAHRRLAGLSVDFVVRDGDHTAHEIVAAAEELDADFIAMATRSRSALGQALFGAIHEEVVRRSTVPVLLIGPRARTLDEPVEIRHESR